MAAPKMLTAEERRARSVELAEAAQLTGAAQLVEERNGYRLYEVPSEDRARVYAVAYDSLNCTVRCSCLAGQHDRACKHAGSVEHAEVQRARAVMTDWRSEAMSSWLKGWDW